MSSFRIPKLSAARQEEAAATAKRAERTKLNELRKQLGLSCQEASRVLPRATHLARSNKRSAASLARRRGRALLLGINLHARPSEKARGKDREYHAREQRKDEQLQTMQHTVARAADLCMTVEIGRLETQRLAREAAADRAEGYRVAQACLVREVQVCQEAEWLARHPEAALLPPKKRVKHAAVLTEELQIARSQLELVQGRLACEQ